jgi:hypothetical protein
MGRAHLQIGPRCRPETTSGRAIIAPACSKGASKVPDLGRQEPLPCHRPTRFRSRHVRGILLSVESNQSHRPRRCQTCLTIDGSGPPATSGVVK